MSGIDNDIKMRSQMDHRQQIRCIYSLSVGWYNKDPDIIIDAFAPNVWSNSLPLLFRVETTWRARAYIYHPLFAPQRLWIC